MARRRKQTEDLDVFDAKEAPSSTKEDGRADAKTPDEDVERTPDAGGKGSGSKVPDKDQHQRAGDDAAAEDGSIDYDQLRTGLVDDADFWPPPLEGGRMPSLDELTDEQIDYIAEHGEWPPDLFGEVGSGRRASAPVEEWDQGEPPVAEDGSIDYDQLRTGLVDDADFWPPPLEGGRMPSLDELTDEQIDYIAEHGEWPPDLFGEVGSGRRASAPVDDGGDDPEEGGSREDLSADHGVPDDNAADPDDGAGKVDPVFGDAGRTPDPVDTAPPPDDPGKVEQPPIEKIDVDPPPASDLAEPLFEDATAVVEQVEIDSFEPEPVMNDEITFEAEPDDDFDLDLG